MGKGEQETRLELDRMVGSREGGGTGGERGAQIRAGIHEDIVKGKKGVKKCHGRREEKEKQDYQEGKRATEKVESIANIKVMRKTHKKEERKGGRGEKDEDRKEEEETGGWLEQRGNGLPKDLNFLLGEKEEPDITAGKNRQLRENSLGGGEEIVKTREFRQLYKTTGDGGR